MAIEFKDYYKTLGVPRSASEDEIRKSFRKLARQYHPDIAKDKATAEERFKEINEAYEVLGDPEKRKKYDTLGENWNQPGGFRPPPGWRQRGGSSRPGQSGAESFEFHFGGTGFSDFFEQFFSGRDHSHGFGRSDPEAGTRSGGGRPFSERGSDIEGDLMVTLAEAVGGSVRTISLQQTNALDGSVATESFRVRIPSGVQENQRIRVAGKGSPGVGGGEPGDLYLRVRFARHPDFRTEGTDLYYDLDLAPWEAVLGATVRIPTLEESISLKIPPGTNHGQKFRVRNRGLPGPGNRRGDLYVAAVIQVPQHVDEDEKKLWQQLAERSAFEPRKTGR